jgi:hypothetical protein
MVCGCGFLEGRREPLHGRQGDALMDQHIASVTGIDDRLCGGCVAGDDNAAIGCIETVAVAFHAMLGWYRRHGDMVILVHLPPSDFVSVHVVCVWRLPGRLAGRRFSKSTL